MNTDSDYYGTEAEQAFEREAAAVLERNVSACADRRIRSALFAGGEGVTTHLSSGEDCDSFTLEKLEQIIASLGRKPFELNGELVPSVALVEQFRFPKSKKKRIRKKWAKRPRNWRPMDEVFVLENGTIYAHPDHLIFRTDCAQTLSPKP